MLRDRKQLTCKSLKSEPLYRKPTVLYISQGAFQTLFSAATENSQAVSIRTAVSGDSGAGSRTSGSLGLPELPWSDWEIKADDIHISKDEDGQPIKLGSGAYGTVILDPKTQMAVLLS